MALSTDLQELEAKVNSLQHIAGLQDAYNNTKNKAFNDYDAAKTRLEQARANGTDQNLKMWSLFWGIATKAFNAQSLSEYGLHATDPSFGTLINLIAPSQYNPNGETVRRALIDAGIKSGLFRTNALDPYAPYNAVNELKALIKNKKAIKVALACGRNTVDLDNDLRAIQKATDGSAYMWAACTNDHRNFDITIDIDPFQLPDVIASSHSVDLWKQFADGSITTLSGRWPRS